MDVGQLERALGATRDALALFSDPISLSEMRLFAQRVLEASIWLQVDVYGDSRRCYDSNGKGIPLCALCERAILDEDPVDDILRVVSGDVRLGVRWYRFWVHASCVESVNKSDGLTTSHTKRDSSATVLLLLQEAGLPFDVAWPIVAGAYWIL